jgi:hypothetical protein
MRLFAMLGIICFHYTDHGPINFVSLKDISSGWWTYAVCRFGGGLGNCIFVLISGYLLCIKKFKFSRLFKLYILVWFYSVASYYFGCFLGLWGLGEHGQLTPILHNKYWFMSTYFCLMLFFPFINILLANINKKQHLILILLILFVSSVLPTFLHCHYYFVDSRLDIFVLLYLIGAYIRLYGAGLRLSRFPRIKIKYCLAALAFILFVCLLYVERRFAVSGKTTDRYIWGVDKTPIIVFSVLIFALLIDCRPKLPKFVDSLATAAFPVYLIHAGALNSLFFIEYFNPLKHFDKFYFPLWLLLSACCIYIICYLVDILRKILFIPINKALDHINIKSL